MPNFVPVVDSTGAPVLSSGGSQRVACAHLAEWLVAYDALQVARGRGHVTYYQTMGGADASAGTHNCGSAWDMAWIGDAAIMDAREMGAAQWHRIPGSNGWPSDKADHCHGLIRCGDNDCNLFQYTAWLGGWNGLGLGGQGAGDPLVRPTNIRTWQQGIIWAHAEIARLTGTDTITEDDMQTLITIQGDPTGAVYITNGITSRRVPDEKSLADLVTLAKEGLIQLSQPTPSATNPYVKSIGGAYVRVVGNPGVLGTVVGSTPAATVDVAALAKSIAALIPVSTAGATIDPAVLSAAIDASLTKALAGVTFTTKRA